jgi:hypothetical protein
LLAVSRVSFDSHLLAANPVLLDKMNETKIVNNRLLPNSRKGAVKEKNSTLVDTVGHNGHTIEIRRYDLGSKIEFRFPWRDQHGKRHFRCCRSLAEARKAAQEFCDAARTIASPAPGGPAENFKFTPEVLAEAARIPGVGQNRVTCYDQTFAQTSGQFLAAKRAKLERGGIRAETFSELECRIRALKCEMGKLKMHELNTERMDEALSAIPGSARSVSNCRDKLRAVLRWATHRNKAPDSVLDDYVLGLFA